MVINKLVRRFSSWSKIFAFLVLTLAFTGGAAMALEPQVEHQGLGIAVWVLTFVFSGLWLLFTVFSKFWPGLKQWKESEAGFRSYVITYTSIAIFLFIMIAISLALH